MNMENKPFTNCGEKQIIAPEWENSIEAETLPNLSQSGGDLTCLYKIARGFLDYPFAAPKCSGLRGHAFKVRPQQDPPKGFYVRFAPYWNK